MGCEDSSYNLGRIKYGDIGSDEVFLPDTPFTIDYNKSGTLKTFHSDTIFQSGEQQLVFFCGKANGTSRLRIVDVKEITE